MTRDIGRTDPNSLDTTSNGPFTNPVDRFAHLPKPTREYLESLREEDIDLLNEAVKFMRSVKTVGKFTKWLIVTIVGSFIVAGQFGEAIQKLLAFLSRGGRP
jgi:hypothetical protein